MSQSYTNSLLLSKNQTQNLFVDINAEYDNSASNQDIVVVNMAAISGWVTNVLMTTPGERHFEPTFGCQLKNLLFSPMTYSPGILQWRIMNSVWTALNKWIPDLHVSIRKSYVTYYPTDGQCVVFLSISLLSIPLSGTISINIQQQAVG